MQVGYVDTPISMLYLAAIRSALCRARKWALVLANGRHVSGITSMGEAGRFDSVVDRSAVRDPGPLANAAFSPGALGSSRDP